MNSAHKREVERSDFTSQKGNREEKSDLSTKIIQ